MSLLRRALGVEAYGNTDTKELAASQVEKTIDTSTTGVSIEESKPDDKYDEFDSAYRKESQVFQSINAKVQSIMASGPGKLVIDKEDARNEEVLEYYNTFLDNLGEIGEESTWEEIIEAIFFAELKHGKHHIEILYNKKHTKVVDLLSPGKNKIDFARDSSGNILLDKYSKPIGYTKQFSQYAEISGKGDSVPKDVELKQGMIFLKPERIAYFWLYGDAFDPVGLIEPAYKSIIRKQNIQEAQANSIYQRGLFPIIDYVGSPERFPTPKMIANATKKLAQMQHNRYFAFPYWHKIEPLEVKQSEVVENTIKALKEEISAALGMPLVLSTGSGEATNKSTLNIQTRFLENSLNDIVKKTLSSIRKNIFKRISNTQNFRDKDGKLIVPRIVWEDVGVESKDDKADRLTKFLKTGGITPEYVMPYVITSEDLKKDDSLVPANTEDKDNSNKELGSYKNKGFSISDVEKILRSL